MKKTVRTKADLIAAIKALKPDSTPPNTVCQASLSEECRAVGKFLLAATHHAKGAVLPSSLLPPML